MTNGEKIKEIFPNFRIDEMSHTVWVGYEVMSFRRDWWNAEYKESTTKNDLGVNCIDRAQAQAEIEMNASRYTIARERDGMGQVEWSDQLIKVSDAVNIIRALPSVIPQEPQSFKWCTDCKEYDQEKHCCHRYSKVIRDTVAEIEQEPFKPMVEIDLYSVIKQKYIEREVLDKIRAEIDNALSDGMIHKKTVLGIIDKYKAESEG